MSPDGGQAPRAMTTANVPDLAFAASSGYIAATTMTITTLTSGQLAIGQQVFGTGVLPNTVITAPGLGKAPAGPAPTR